MIEDSKGRKTQRVTCPICFEHQRENDGELPTSCYSCGRTGSIRVPEYRNDPPTEEELLERYKLLVKYNPDRFDEDEEYYHSHCVVESKHRKNKCPQCDGEGWYIDGGWFDPYDTLCELCLGMQYVADWDLAKWKERRSKGLDISPCFSL